MKLTIVIPTFNEEKYLPHLLSDIKKQTFKDYEVIVSDANSKDKTVEIAKKYNCKIVKGGLPSVGRNRGAEAGEGDLILFLDSDVRLPSKHIFRDAINEFIDRNLDLAVCDLELESKSIFNKILWELTNIFIRLNQYGKKPQACGAFILIKRAYFYITGGFDEEIVFAEDADFIERVVKKKAKFRILNLIYVSTSDRRFRKEGSIKLITKSLILVGYRNLVGPIKKEILKYEFGNYDEKDSLKMFKKLKEIRIAMRENMKDNYDKIVKNILKMFNID